MIPNTSCFTLDMGNYKLRLSEMIPNAWFYKLKDISRTKKHRNSPSALKTRLSSKTSTPKPGLIVYKTEPTKAHRHYNSPVESKVSDSTCPDPPRKSSKQKAKKKAIYKPSNKLFFSSLDQTRPNPFHYSPYCSVSSSKSSTTESNIHETIPSKCDSENFGTPNPFLGSSTRDTIFDLNEEDYSKKKAEMKYGFDLFSEMDLTPIQTKSMNVKQRRTLSSKCEEIKGQKSLCVNIDKEESIRTQRKLKGIRLRANSQKLANKKMQACTTRKSISSKNNKAISDSFIVVKFSNDPQKDFKSSMMKMIVENGIWTCNDLEELLACYLSLNSQECHDLIVMAFEQIWFDMAEIRKWNS